MWYERNCDLIWLVTDCCSCSIWACWQLRESISTERSSCSRVFFRFTFAKGHVPFFSLSFRFYHHLVLSDGWLVTAFNSLAISLRAYLFNLICFNFLWGPTTVSRFLSGASWLTAFTLGSLETLEKSFGVDHLRYLHLHCQLPQSVSLFCIFTIVFFISITIIRFNIFLYKWSFMCRETQSDFGIGLTKTWVHVLKRKWLLGWRKASYAFDAEM